MRRFVFPRRLFGGACALGCAAIGFVVAGCGGSGNVDSRRLVPTGPWTTGTSDHTAETAPPDPAIRVESLPSPFSGKGLLLEGTNRSDDLLLYAAQPLEGLPAGSTWNVDIDVEILTDTPTGCVGVGGSPGESVWIVTAATPFEPATTTVGGNIQLNIERGNQSQAGPASDVPGTIASTNTDCAVRRAPESKWLRAKRTIPASAGNDGRLWILVGMDSGFEAKSRVWIRDVAVRLRPRP